MGNGVDGQLGHGTAVSEWVPRQIAFFKDLAVTAIGCGTAHSTATSRTGFVYTWGRGAEGQLGLDLEGDSTVDVVDNSVWVPHPVGILKGSAHRVTVRTMVAKQNMTLALDDRDRMFVWGDNALEQLGLPLSVNTQHGTKSFLPKPRLLAYMDLRAPKTASCGSPSSSLSRVSSLRELVAAAKPDQFVSDWPMLMQGIDTPCWCLPLSPESAAPATARLEKAPLVRHLKSPRSQTVVMTR